MYHFQVDHRYTRKDVYKIIGIPMDTKGGNWDTGYNKYKDDFFIFTNIGMPGRTGHDYANKFIGEKLRWYSKRGTNIHQPQIKELLNPPGYVYIFFRTDNSQPFIYAGTGLPVSYKDQSPVEITWELSNGFDDIPLSKKEVDSLSEGTIRKVASKSFERNPLARKICVEHYGYLCQVCGFDFQSRYGNVGSEFIHIHHIKPLSEIQSEYLIDPIKDLRQLCPNCHAMLHRKKPPYSIEELKELINVQEKVSKNERKR